MKLLIFALGLIGSASQASQLYSCKGVGSSLHSQASLQIDQAHQGTYAVTLAVRNGSLPPNGLSANINATFNQAVGILGGKGKINGTNEEINFGMQKNSTSGLLILSIYSSDKRIEGGYGAFFVCQ